MKFTFVSNYINHHQLPLAKAMYEKLGADYAFIQTEPMEEERIKLGWGEEEEIPFLHKYYEEESACRKLIMESDIVMFGGVEDENYILERLEEGKPVIRYAERFYKDGRYKAVSPRGLKKKFHDHTKYRKAPVYLLCAGAYVAGDYEIIRAYPKKKYTWGYFPEKKEYTLEELFLKKVVDKEILANLLKEWEDETEETALEKLAKNEELQKEEAEDSKKREEERPFSYSDKKVLDLLWAGRMIGWKHPEYVIQLAKDLKKAKNLPEWKITMIGGGAMEEEIKSLAKKYAVEDCITFTGTMKPTQVRAYMENADIYLFTSDYREGWGAVMNEAMNSGACVVANCGIGAAHSLIRMGENGLLYPNKEYDAFLGHVKGLMLDTKTRLSMAKNAYDTIANTWNPEHAAEVLLDFSEAILTEYEKMGPFGIYKELKGFQNPKEGPLSKAKLR